MIMDRAYEGDSMRAEVAKKGFTPVVPPKSNRKEPWQRDKEKYKQRNEVERYFLRLKRFRKIFTRYDKLDAIFSGFIYFAMSIDSILV
jgi:transposase